MKGRILFAIFIFSASINLYAIFGIYQTREALVLTDNNKNKCMEVLRLQKINTDECIEALNKCVGMLK